MITREIGKDTWAAIEVAALRLLFTQEAVLAAPSDRQLKAINALLGQGLTDQRRAVRLEVLRMITGIENLTSSAQLTAYTVRVLIDYLKVDIEGDWRLSMQGKRLLAVLEAHAIELVDDRKKASP